MTVRKATKEDIPFLEKLLYQVNDVHANGRPDLFLLGKKKYTTEELTELLLDEKRPVFLAEEDEKLGYAFCVFQEHVGENQPEHTTLYIDDLCVDEEVRSGGVGKALYEHVLKFAKEAGCYNVTLNVWECNPKAKGFYEHLGLKVQKTAMECIL